MEEIKDNKILIASTDRCNDRLHIKVRRKMKNSFSPNEYSKVINLKDANDLALLLEDISIILGAPVDKAFRIYQENKGRGFPF